MVVAGAMGRRREDRPAVRCARGSRASRSPWRRGRRWPSPPSGSIACPASTPPRPRPPYDRVGVLEIGPAQAKNILVLNPGTSASAAYFAPLAKTIVEAGAGLAGVGGRAPREPARGPLGARPRQGRQGHRAAGLRLLPRLAHRPEHHRPLPARSRTRTSATRASGGCASRSRTCAASSRRRSGAAAASCVGGHSLGGSITTAYATWDFDGEPGAEDLAGLVFIDGGSGPTPGHAPSRRAQSLARPGERLALADLRRHPRAVRGPVQLDRLDRRDRSIRTRRRSARTSRCCRRT